MQEKSKKYNENENYLIFDDGNVFSLKINKFLKLSESNCGYLFFCDYKNGRKKTTYVHRVVAAAFLANQQNFKTVNHIDGDKKNNMVSNLEWCSLSENIKHAYRTGLKSISEVQKIRAKTLHTFVDKDKRRERAKFLNRPIRKVKCTKTGVVYESIASAAKKHSVPKSSLGKMLNNKMKNVTTLVFNEERIK